MTIGPADGLAPIGPGSGLAPIGPGSGLDPAAARLIVLTDRGQARSSLPSTIAQAVSGGVRLVLLREKDLPAPERAVLAEQLLAILSPAGGRLIVASPSPPADPSQPADPSPPADPSQPATPSPSGGSSRAAGLHLAASDPWPSQPGRVLGRSCHCLAEVAIAAERGASYATLSPIFVSRSKPGYGPALGLAPLREPAPIPVYALGGVETAERARQCFAAGAAGVAVMGAIMRSPDPAAFAHELLLNLVDSVSQQVDQAMEQPIRRAAW